MNPDFVLGNVTVTLPAAALHLPAAAPRTFENVPNGLNTTYCVGSLATVKLNGPPLFVFGVGFLKAVYTVFRKGVEGEVPSVGFARLAGVDYAGNGTAIIGWGGDGIDGDIGNTGPDGVRIESTDSDTSVAFTVAPATVTLTSTIAVTGPPISELPPAYSAAV